MTDKNELRSHNYDGIQEYDNDLPKWWLWLFWITIIFAVIYPFIYDFGPGEFASETVDKEVSQLASKSSSAAGSAVTEEGLLKLVSDPDTLNKGQVIYTTRCFACHAEKGAGLIGPNLTDDYWIHGGKITDIHKTVSEGVLDKGMLSWKGQLTPDQLNSVVAFVWSLHGTNPPNGKAPQGDFVARK